MTEKETPAAASKKKQKGFESPETFMCRRALVGPPKLPKPSAKKGKPETGKFAVTSGMFAPVTSEVGKGFRAVLQTTVKGNKGKKGKGKR